MVTVDCVMESVLKSVTVSQHIIYEDALVDSWLLPSSPGLVMGLVLSYLTFVLYLGPRIMANKKPYDLKYFMMTYNLAQIIYNFCLVTMLFTTDGALSYLSQHYCHPLDFTLNPLRLDFCSALWHFTVLKFLDLLHTVLYVLRKKQDHVTFLHVYHHAVMATASWVTLKYIRGEQAVFLGFMSVLSQIVMYSYYFLAAIGESVRPYLWWKKYLTTLQILQFVCGVIYLTSLVIMGCDLPRLFTYIWWSQIILFLVLFVNFYVKTYVRVPASQKAKTQ